MYVGMGLTRNQHGVWVVRHKIPERLQADNDKARARALRDAEYASLTRRAATENGRALIADVYERITAYEAGRQGAGVRSCAGGLHRRLAWCSRTQGTCSGMGLAEAAE